MGTLIGIGHPGPNRYQGTSAHSHPFWEIVLYTEGEGVISLKGQDTPFLPGSVICLPPQEPHWEVTTPQGYRNYCLAVTGISFGELAPHARVDTGHPLYTVTSLLHQEFLLFPGSPKTSLLFDLLLHYLQEEVGRIPQERWVEELKRLLVAGMEESGFQVKEAMAQLPVSRDHLRRLFQKSEGVTPHEYMTGRRISRAMHLLKTGCSIKETAAAVGLPDPYYFSRAFRKTTGRTPSAYQKEMHKAEGKSGNDAACGSGVRTPVYSSARGKSSP